MERGYIEISSVLVDLRIFETSYICDIKGCGCDAICCYRGCVITPSEIKKIEEHLPGILSYLSAENREAINKNGSFVAQCHIQCPEGCNIHTVEAKAVKSFFKDPSDFRCTLVFNDICIFIYTNNEGLKCCAIHSYAMENKINIEDIKQIDCIQYPLMVYRENGKRILTLQETPHISRIPCVGSNRGEPIYKGLNSAIEILLGREFSEKLHAYGRKYNKGKEAR